MMKYCGGGCPKTRYNFTFFALLVWVFCLGGVAGAQTQCGEDLVCHEALVKFSRLASSSDIREILQQHGAVVIQRFPHLRLYHVRFHSDDLTANQVENLAQDWGVLKASPNWIVHAQATPNDPSYNLLWGLHNEGQTGGTPGVDIGMEDVWDNFTDGSSVIVAVIDTGIDFNHPDLAANIWTNPGEIPGNGIDDDGNGFIDDVHGYDFRNHDGNPMDDHGHGTHVAGTIGAIGNNGVGVTGVNWKASIMAVKFLSSGASGSLSDAIAGINYALDNGALILNNSWGGGGFDFGLFSAVLDSDEAGTVFVAAAGNNGSDIDSHPFYPAAYNSPNVISVAAVHQDDGLAGFSNFGKVNVDLAAPGSSIYSTMRNNNYGYMSGTSMATPHVSGAAALLWSQFPTLTHRQVIQILFQSVTSKDYLQDVTVTGGMLNLPNAMAIAGDSSNQVPVANAGPDQTVAVGDTVNLSGSATDGDGDFPLLFEWNLSVPPGSQSQLNNPNDPNPNFVPDHEGTYTASLVVSDFTSSSIADSAVITVSGVNIPPPTVVIKAQGVDPETGNDVELGSGIPTRLGSPVQLDGSQSQATFSYLMVFEWSLVETPLGSLVSVGTPGEQSISLTPDREGTYTVRLTVDDGFNESFADFSFVAAVKKETVEQVPQPVSPPSEPGAGNGEAGTGAGGCSLQKN